MYKQKGYDSGNGPTDPPKKKKKKTETILQSPDPNVNGRLNTQKLKDMTPAQRAKMQKRMKDGSSFDGKFNK